MFVELFLKFFWKWNNQGGRGGAGGGLAVGEGETANVNSGKTYKDDLITDDSLDRRVEVLFIFFRNLIKGCYLEWEAQI